MNVRRFAMQLRYSLAGGALVVMSVWPSPVLAQGDHDHAFTSANQPTPQQQKQASALVAKVREVTAGFRNAEDAPSDYVLTFGCVSGGDLGAMGVHLVNFGFVGDKEIDVNKPDLLVYEPTANGGLQLVAADYLVFKKDWEEHHAAPPELMGQLFHLFDKPNRFGLDPFYTLHVWAWKDNPNGTFANWNPNVSCDAFNPPPSN